MALALRAHRAPTRSRRPAAATQGDSPWPIILMAVLFMLGFVLISFMVVVIFTPTMGG
ncbi:MAG: hypothetical protein HKN04_09855 [Rhodothermaceae bacterium]|nr:hypothetical protein [Rhodothermaceae bacterium]